MKYYIKNNEGIENKNEKKIRHWNGKKIQKVYFFKLQPFLLKTANYSLCLDHKKILAVNSLNKLRIVKNTIFNRLWIY